MKGLAYTALVFVVSCIGCAHEVIRTGYDVRKSDLTECPMLVMRDITSIDSMQRIGIIELRHPGSASQACSESRALRRLRREGCAIGADVVHLAKERWPEYESECYECVAVFYTYNDSIYVPDQTVITEFQDRVQANDRRTGRTILRIIGTGMVITRIITWVF